jgi:3-oxoacyl-[acyl-carrier-protein] synthase-3
VLTNSDLAKIVDTSDEWITERTGIKERRVVGPDEAASDLAYEAAVHALDDAGIDGSALDAVLVATVCADYLFPATGCLLQERIGAKRAFAYDFSAACSGFIFGRTSTLFITSMCERILVVGVET